MNPPEKQGTQIGERRKHSRRSSDGTVVLTVDARGVEGRIENISKSGVLFFSEGDLRVTVQVHEKGTTTTRTGRIVRAQRMRGDSFGWAVEFDP